jgi:4-amino-4-deoxy-L-arabinose transferase-like glycosyltransferase
LSRNGGGGTRPGSAALPALLFVVAGALFLLAWLPSWFGPAGVFIDEAYYLACANHLALGYVDHPPFSIFVLAGLRGLAGDALPVLRFLPALAGAAAVLMAGGLARSLGAGAWGQLLAGIAVASAPVLHVLLGFYSMNAFALLFWTGVLWLLVEIEERDEPRLWLAVGALAGVGLQNKHTLAVLAVGLGAGMLLTRARRHFASPWLWAGLGLAALLIAPNLLWQASHDWASLDFYRQADLLKNNPTPALDVLVGQVIAVNPVALPIWLAGLAFLLISKRGASLRHLGLLFLILLGLLVTGEKSRPDRIAGVYPLLFGAGAAFLDEHLRRPGLSWLRTAYPILLAVVGVGLAPVAFPLLLPETMAVYTERLGVVPQIEAGEDKVSRLPQWLADRYGWERLVDDVEDVVSTLSPAELENTVIFGASYGQAAPVEHLGRGRGLPPVYSGHNSYYFWGPPPDSVEVAVFVGFSEEGPDGRMQPDPRLQELFARVELAHVHRCAWCMAWRDEMPIWIAREPKRPFSELWSELRRFL